MCRAVVDPGTRLRMYYQFPSEKGTCITGEYWSSLREAMGCLRSPKEII
jgi:hypothetical protein